MIDINSFITIKQGTGSNHFYVTLDYLLENLGISEMRSSKSYPIKDYKIESWNNSEKVFIKLLSVKKIKSPIYRVRFDNLSSIMVGENCSLLLANDEFKKITELKVGDEVRGVSKFLKIKGINLESKSGFVYELKLENDLPYFVDGVIIKV